MRRSNINMIFTRHPSLPNTVRFYSACNFSSVGKNGTSSMSTIKKHERRIEPRKKLFDADGNEITPERRPKRNTAIFFGYLGSKYFGSNYITDLPTVEKEMFDAIVKAEGISKFNAGDLNKNKFKRAAKTDKGVHAVFNTLSLKLFTDDDKLIEKIRSHLPPDIKVWGSQRVINSFSARSFCSSRFYEYLFPTYLLIPPNHRSKTGKLLSLKHSDYWNFRDKILSQKYTLQQVINNEKVIYDAYANKTLDDLTQSQKDFFHEDLHLKRYFRIPTDTLQKFREYMNIYQGGHNFHNFTKGLDAKDARCYRVMKSINVSDPFVNNGVEYLSIKLHGESFIMHQIRKMLGFASLLVRCDLPKDKIEKSLHRDNHVHISKMPSAGLFLYKTDFANYNRKLETLQKTIVDYQSLRLQPIDADKYEKELMNFKFEQVYPKIFDKENDDAFSTFNDYVDNSIFEDVFESVMAL